MSELLEQLIATVDDIFTEDDYVHRSPISMSMLGRCRRQGAYALRDGGWPETASSSSPQAWLGKAIHKVLLEDLSRRIGGMYEYAVQLACADTVIKGTTDLLLPGAKGVLDLKTTSDRWYSVVSGRVPWSNRLQATGYGMATGTEVCMLLYVNRSDGNRFIEEWRTEQYADDVELWVADCHHAPEQVERDERGPGLSLICDDCPWARECWGISEDADLEKKRAQSIVVVEEGIEMVLDSYDEAREREKSAKADKEFWKTALDGHDPAAYGQWNLGWSKPRPKPVLDEDEARRLLTAAGLPIPTKMKTSAPSISVTRRKDDQGE